MTKTSHKKEIDISALTSDDDEEVVTVKEIHIPVTANRSPAISANDLTTNKVNRSDGAIKADAVTFSRVEGLGSPESEKPLEYRLAESEIDRLNDAIVEISHDLPTLKAELAETSTVVSGLEQDVPAARITIERYESAKRSAAKCDRIIANSEKTIVRYTKRIEQKEKVMAKIIDKLNHVKNGVQRPRKNSLAEKLWSQFDGHLITFKAAHGEPVNFGVLKSFISDKAPFKAATEKAYLDWAKFNDLAA